MSGSYNMAFSRMQTKQQAESTDPPQKAMSTAFVDTINAFFSLLDNSVNQYSSNTARNWQQKYANQVYNHLDVPASWFYNIFYSTLKAIRVLFPSFYEETTC